ncbi:MAG: hypothetical protein KAS40_07990, partial [Desulfobacterales bacterium]|nr:hypothetical protein [Desulfobacterales bacterium]
GKEIELSHGNFSTFLISPNREVRKKAFFQYYQAYEDHKHTLAATLMHSLKKDFFYSRVRNFDNCRAAALFGDNIPEAVYDNLVKTVRSNLTPFFKYMDFRKEALALSDLHFYDTYVPIVSDVTFHIPYEAAVEMSIQAMRPLGEKYIKILKEGLLETYFGDTLVLDSELSLECLRIPHFYSAFYVYKYATGISAAIALADRVVNEGQPARDAYLNFLKLGGSKFPLDELVNAGVDMRSPDPIRRAINYFSDLVDRLINAYQAL